MTCEIMRICQILTEVVFEASILAKLWCDNKATLHTACNLVFHKRYKHVEIKYHFFREKI